MAIVVHDTPVVEEVPGEVVPAVPGLEDEAPAEAGTVDPDTEVGSDDGDIVPDGDGVDEPSGLTFNGVDVNVDIPDDLAANFSEKGLDITSIISDLYSGEFGLSKENHAKMSEVYGAALVDQYIAGVKAQNQMTQDSLTSAQEAQAKADAAIWAESMEQVGGEDKWTAMEEWASKSLSDEEFSDFNKMMEGGSRYSQKLAIADMMARQSAAEGDSPEGLIAGDNTNPGGAPDSLSQAEYLQLFKTGEYSKNPGKYDAMRRMGQSRGH